MTRVLIIGDAVAPTGPGKMTNPSTGMSPQFRPTASQLIQ